MFTRTPPPSPPHPGSGQDGQPASNQAAATPGQAPAAPMPHAAGQPQPLPPGMSAPSPQAGQTPPRPAAPAGEGTSVIGRDLTIVGTGLRIVTKGTLRVDGVVKGDVVGTTIIITGQVVGRVHAEKVTVEGVVQGSVTGIEVQLKSNGYVEGDIVHASLGIEEGAGFDGRSRRERDSEKLKPNLDPDAPMDAPDAPLAPKPLQLGS